MRDCSIVALYCRFKLRNLINQLTCPTFIVFVGAFSYKLSTITHNKSSGHSVNEIEDIVLVSTLQLYRVTVLVIVIGEIFLSVKAV